MKKRLTLLAFALLPLVASAFTGEVVIDGLNYYINTNEQTAEVRKFTGQEYTGDIVIPSTVTYEGVTCQVTAIESFAFYLCKGLTSVTIGEGVKSIRENCFNGCEKLATVHIPSSVASVGASAFQNCTSLTAVELPDGMQRINTKAFSGCTSLASVKIGSGIKEIGSSAFYKCASLTSVTLPVGLTTIFKQAFSQTALTSINIPDGVTYIGGGGAFRAAPLFRWHFLPA